MSYNLKDGIPESDLPLKSPGPVAEPRYVENGKGYRAPAGSWASWADIAVIHGRIAGVDGDVEQLGDRVGNLEAGQSAGQKVYRTWSELSAVTGSAGVGAQVIDDTGTHTDPVVGGTVANAGQYVWSESPAGWRWVRPDVLALKADKAEVDQLAGQVAVTAGDLSNIEAAVSATRIYTLEQEIPRTGLYGFGSFRGWQWGFEYNGAGNIRRIDTALTVSAAVAFVRLSVHVRPNPATTTAAPTTGDVEHYVGTFSVEELGLDPGNTTGQVVQFLIPSLAASAVEGKAIYVTVEALNAAGELAADANIGIGREDGDFTGLPAWKRGRWKTTGLWSSLADTTQRVAYAILSEAFTSPVQQIPTIASELESTVSELESVYDSVSDMLDSGEFGMDDIEVGSIPATNVYNSGSFTGWTWAADPGVELVSGSAITKLVMPRLNIGSTVSELQLKVYKRALDSAVTSAPPQSGDVLVGDYAYTPAELDLTPGDTTGKTTALAVDLVADPGYMLLFQLTAQDSDGERAFIGVGRTTADNDAVPLRKRGWWRTTAGWSSHSGNRVSYSCYRSGLFSVSQKMLDEAAGVRDSLADRISQALDPYGSPRRMFNAAVLRQYHYRRRRLIRALAASTTETIQNHVALLGTSWTQNPERWSGAFAEAIYAEQGHAAPGWVSASYQSGGGTWVIGGSQPSSINGNVLRDAYMPQWAGAWSSGNGGTQVTNYGGYGTPDCAIAETTADGAEWRCPIPAGMSGVTLYWAASADGVVRYSYDAGATWTSLNVQGETDKRCYWADLAAPPSAGATLRVQRVSGTVRLSGVNIKSTKPGAVVHKLAVGGSGVYRLASQAAKAGWKESLASLGITTAIIMHGTNDQGGTNGLNFGANMESVADAILAAIPACDIAFVVEAENARTTNVTPMVEISRQAALVAGRRKFAFYDTQMDFGPADNPTYYQAIENGGTLPLFNASDLFHPDPATGGPLIADGMLRFVSGVM